MFKKVCALLRKTFDHPVFITYNPVLDLYALHPCTHSDMAPDIFGEIRKTILLGATDFQGNERLQFIADTGYYMTTEVWTELVRLEHIKFKKVDTEKSLLQYFVDTIGTERCEQIVKLTHLRAKQVYTSEFFETPTPEVFKLEKASYKFIRKTKVACYIKALL